MNPSDWSERLLTALIATDRSGAAKIVGEAKAGIDPRQVIADILDPAIVRLGRSREEAVT